MCAAQQDRQRELGGLDDVGVPLRDPALAVLHLLPRAVDDDAEFGNISGNPVLRWVDPGEPQSRLQVLDVAQ